MYEDLLKFKYFLVLLQISFAFYTASAQLAELPPSEFPSDNSTFKIYVGTPTSIYPRTTTTNLNVPPHLFPENDSNYTIVQNLTILNTLVSHGLKKEKNIDTEVPDLLQPIHHEELASNITTNKTEVKQITSSDITAKSTTTDPIFDSELIESDNSKTEDIKLNNSSTVRLSDIHANHNHTHRSGAALLQGQLAAILAGVFAFIAVMSYVGLLTWRRYLEHRYGNREMLINEEEYINYNDIKHFEL